MSRRGWGMERWANSVTAPARRRALAADHPASPDVVFVIGPSSEGVARDVTRSNGWRFLEDARSPATLCRVRGATGRS